MTINKILIVAAVAISGIAVVMSACTTSEQTIELVSAPTPTPPTAHDIYNWLENVATQQPSRLERALKNKRYMRFKGRVTDTEIGKIQFHLDPRQELGYDRYINCDMRNELDADIVSVEQEVVVKGNLKDAFNQGGWFGSLKELKNEKVIEFKDCVILKIM